MAIRVSKHWYLRNEVPSLHTLAEPIQFADETCVAAVRSSHELIWEPCLWELDTCMLPCRDPLMLHLQKMSAAKSARANEEGGNRHAPTVTNATIAVEMR